MIFFTSDLHLGHRSVISMCERPFDSVEEMNQTSISNINARVGVDDELYMLGDVSCRIGVQRAEALLRGINCKHLHLIRGNHDRNWENVDLFEEVCDYKELKLDDTRVVLMHYPIASWNGMYRGSVHLHGHVHSKPGVNVRNAELGNRIWDVGVDANNYSPISWEEIKQSLQL